MEKKEYKIEVRQFLTKPNPKYPDKEPVPMRVMYGTIERETPKGLLVKMKGKPAPTSHCMVCGRQLKHPVSLLYGIGPECGEHYHINPFGTEEELNEHYESLRQKLADVTYDGWLPKFFVTCSETGETITRKDEPQEQPKPKPEPKQEEKKDKGNVFELQKSREQKERKFQIEATDAVVETLVLELEKGLQ